MRPSGAQRGLVSFAGAQVSALRLRRRVGAGRAATGWCGPCWPPCRSRAARTRRAAVGGNLRIADALQAHQVLDGEGRVSGLAGVAACGAGRAGARTSEPDAARRRRRIAGGGSRERTEWMRRAAFVQPTSLARRLVQGSFCAACTHSCRAASSSTLAMYQRAVSRDARAVGVEAQHHRRVHRVRDGVLAEQPRAAVRRTGARQSFQISSTRSTSASSAGVIAVRRLRARGVHRPRDAQRR